MSKNKQTTSELQEIWGQIAQLKSSYEEAKDKQYKKQFTERYPDYARQIEASDRLKNYSIKRIIEPFYMYRSSGSEWINPLSILPYKPPTKEERRELFYSLQKQKQLTTTGIAIGFTLLVGFVLKAPIIFRLACAGLISSCAAIYIFGVLPHEPKTEEEFKNLFYSIQKQKQFITAGTAIGFDLLVGFTLKAPLMFKLICVGLVSSRTLYSMYNRSLEIPPKYAYGPYTLEEIIDGVEKCNNALILKDPYVKYPKLEENSELENSILKEVKQKRAIYKEARDQQYRKQFTERYPDYARQIETSDLLRNYPIKRIIAPFYMYSKFWLLEPQGQRRIDPLSVLPPKPRPYTLEEIIDGVEKSNIASVIISYPNEANEVRGKFIVGKSYQNILTKQRSKGGENEK
jgi:hypothetical protein